MRGPGRSNKDTSRLLLAAVPRAGWTAMASKCTLLSFFLLLAVLTISAESAKVANCHCKCDLKYVPVCATDEKGNAETFPNACMLSCYTCTHEKYFRIVRKGECPELDKPSTAKPTRPSLKLSRSRSSRSVPAY